MCPGKNCSPASREDPIDDLRAHVAILVVGDSARDPKAYGFEDYEPRATRRDALVMTSWRSWSCSIESAAPTGSLMICAIPEDDGPRHLREQLGVELGSDGWLEDSSFENGRDPIWYCSLLHYAGPLTQPAALIDWVDGNSDVTLGNWQISSVQIVTWRRDPDGVTPAPVATVNFQGSSARGRS